MGELIEGLGLATYALLWITALLGLNAWKLHWIRIPPKYHYAGAILALLCATTHAALIALD